jgi:hypothetical protein
MKDNELHYGTLNGTSISSSDDIDAGVFVASFEMDSLYIAGPSGLSSTSISAPDFSNQLVLHSGVDVTAIAPSVVHSYLFYVTKDSSNNPKQLRGCGLGFCSDLTKNLWSTFATDLGGVVFDDDLNQLFWWTDNKIYRADPDFTSFQLENIEEIVNGVPDHNGVNIQIMAAR